MKVMTKVLRFPTVLLLACSALAGCVSQPVSMYRLDNGTVEVPEQVDGAAVLLGQPTSYLLSSASFRYKPKPFSFSFPVSFKNP